MLNLFINFFPDNVSDVDRCRLFFIFCNEGIDLKPEESSSLPAILSDPLFIEEIGLGVMRNSGLSLKRKYLSIIQVHHLNHLHSIYQG